MIRYADVALPVAVEKTFTYLVPPELQPSARAGVRVIVPFGRKYTTGVIVGLPESSSLTSLKPLKDILDAAPVFPDELLGLCRWIAEYYMAPLGEVLKAAVPLGLASSGKRLVRLATVVPSVVDLERNAPKRARLVRLLQEHGPMTSRELQKRVGLKTINAVLNEMVQAGYLETEELIPLPKQSIRTMPVLLVDGIQDDRLASVLGSMPPRKKKARQLLAAIQWLKKQGTAEIPVPTLLKKANVPSSTLKQFVEDGLLSTVKREVPRRVDYGTEEQTLSLILNEPQRHVLGRVTDAMHRGMHRTFLLHGVTGSGKTQVYIEAIRECLRREKTAIVLVPEISLTPQIVRRFKSHFGEKVAVVHSRMSAGERYDAWRLAARGEYRIVIGPRSAIFAPLKNLGLIVVDEEHEASYKQFDATPRYHARDVAIVRGRDNHAVVVLGSATPSTESYHNAMTGKYELLEMPERVDKVPMPSVTIVDMIEERKREYAEVRAMLTEGQGRKLKAFQQSSISSLLKAKITDRLSRKEGIILLQNRRGFAPFIECMDCGYSEMCDNCSVTMTYHLAKKHLRCHYCGVIRSPHTACPQCGGPNLQLRGIGTQRVEEELRTLFPDATLQRMDLDTTSRKGAHDRILNKFGSGETDILLGTQMVAKGLDFPRVTLVGVISADTQMLLPDFRSSERTFQLLTQVAGRAGRSTLSGEVIIQTHQPQHYTLQHVVDHDFKSFYEQELRARQELDYPPFSRLVLIECRGGSEERVRRQSERIGKLLKSNNGAFTVLGPSPAVIGKINNQYRWHIIIKNSKTHDPAGAKLRVLLRNALAVLNQPRSSVRTIIDVDPVGLL
jgi:primosomal protein N' (replication factor Y)